MFLDWSGGNGDDRALKRSDGSRHYSAEYFRELADQLNARFEQWSLQTGIACGRLSPRKCGQAYWYLVKWFRHDRDAADDCWQETMKALCAMTAHCPNSDEKNPLEHEQLVQTIAGNKASDEYRRRRREGAVFQDNEGEILENLEGVAKLAADNEKQAAESRDLLVDVLSLAKTPEQRLLINVIVTMAGAHDLSQRELAKASDLKRGKVRYNLEQLREKFRDYCRKDFPEVR